MNLRLLPIIALFLLISCGQSKKKTDWQLTGFQKLDEVNPILSPDTSQVFACPVTGNRVSWEARNVLNPAAVVKDGKVYLLYRAQDADMTSRIGLATSEDGVHFTKAPEPIFYPGNDSMKRYEWPGGVEDPRIVESEDGRYILTYTSYDGATARLCIASSLDLSSWTKHGLALAGEKYRDLWSKSGAIVVKKIANRMVAERINGRYWMYFGDTDLFIATSDNLIDWEVLEDGESGQPIRVMNKRPGFFDSRLVEPGPYALLTEKGILLIYNGSNAANHNDPNLPKFTYSAGQALFDATAPYNLQDRSAEYFLKPDKPYERTGEVNEVCFVEGLVYFKDKWFLYYGTADRMIAVAVATNLD